VLNFGLQFSGDRRRIRQEHSYPDSEAGWLVEKGDYGEGRVPNWSPEPAQRAMAMDWRAVNPASPAWVKAGFLGQAQLPVSPVDLCKR